MYMGKKIDIHCHTTNRIVHGLEGSLEKISYEMKKYDVEQTVVLATYFPHRGSGISNFRLLNWTEQHNKTHQKEEFKMFGSLDFEHYFYQGYNELEELANQQKIAGIKIYTGYQKIDLKGDKFRKVIDLAKQKNLPLMFHGGDTSGSWKQYGKIAYEQEVSAETLEFIPSEYGIKTIICHLGYPFIDDTIDVLKRNPLMYADMSGLFYSREEAHKLPYAVDHTRRVLEYCGPNQMLFGTDFPVHIHEHAISIVENAMKNFTEKDREKVYYQNAREVLYGK